ncbi:hypothetical protein [Methanothermococcus okinawensis]|uniref:Nitrite and sulphite reductase 4Fe-4S region n=1 Tax=Methanothermococcus okinawensis (strain DSM 14208 / JCM 11175 / IH1) TaxID=647113 RepID=F8AML6_METOI|nr:hypothetical protein [Methanothermococcus okinawensis]AEH06057.1 nitrite and sulphite reductase 4Fe-4S region [Methanothermococcus okinawensis IH1]
MFCDQNYKFGVLPKKDGFMIRISLKPGYITSKQLDTISHVANHYGDGRAHITNRQGIELKIKHEYLEDAEKLLNESGLKLGSTGKRIRQVKSCIGLECQNSIGDAISIAERLHNEFEGIWVPKKLKINISACPNDCAWAKFCDIGIIFRYIIGMDYKNCSGCGKCEEFCEAGAPNWRAHTISEKCIGTGECLKLCGALHVKEKVMAIYVGGKGGKFPKMGRHISNVKTEDEIIDIVDLIVEKYAKYGKKRIYDLVKEYNVNTIEDIENI